MQQQVVLVDGSGYLFRAFHALPPLANADGMPTGAIYGVMNMLRRLEQDYPDAEIVVVFDPPGPTERHTIFPEYKANRGKMPDDLALQIEPLHRLIRAKGYPLCIVPGQEADDVIGTLARMYVDAGCMVVICTGDKDFAQLVCDDIVLLDTMRNRLLDEKGVEEKFGVRPDQIVDYLALIGDTSDNIPGVNKVGPKTATKWLGEYGTIKSLIENADALTGKVGEHLRAAIPDLALYQKLVTICQTVDLGFDWKALARSSEDVTVLKQSFETLGFRSWLKEVEGGYRHQAALDFDVVEDEQSLRDRCRSFSDASMLGVSVYIDPLHLAPSLSVVPVAAVSVFGDGQSLFIPCAALSDGQRFCDWDQVFRVFSETIFQSCQIVLEDSKFLYKYLLRDAPQIELTDCSILDLTVMAYVLKGSNRIGLLDLADEFLGQHLPSRDEVLGKGAKRLAFSEMSCSQLGAVLAREASLLVPIWRQLIESDPGSFRLYDDVDGPLIAVLADMELRGALLNVDALIEQSALMATQIDQLNKTAHDLAGEAFNTASVKQLQSILYDKLGLPVIEKTPKGDPSTSESVLMALSDKFELPKVILEVRSLSKLKSTYLDALPALSIDRRVHCSFQQTITATGRLSCQNPNLQNIPVRTEAGRAVRQAFIAPRDHVLVSFDYSQIELRIMAHISQDQALLRAFSQDEDVHNFTACELFSLSPDEVGSNERRIAKVINFGLIYGMSAFGLAKQLGLDRGTAQAYIDRYFERYPGVKDYMEKTRSQAVRDGYVKTVLGRKIYLPDIRHNKVSVRRAAERAAINAPMRVQLQS